MCVSCFGDAPCASETLMCRPETRECLADGAEPACSTGEFCDPLGRCVQCTRSADCGPGLFCNRSVGRCESNVQCANDVSECPVSSEVMCVLCEPPNICDPRTRRCQAPPTLCENDTDCGDLEFCDRTLDLPVCVPRVPDCFNDRLDEPPNDTPARARLLDPAAGPAYDELKLCPGDQDWYRLDVPAGTYLTVDARFEHDLGDLELQLYLLDGTTLVDQSRTITDNERVELEVGTDRSLLVRAFFAAPTVRDLPYRLIATLDPGAVCPDDGAEPNDGAAEAQPLASNQTIEGRLCPADPDWFVLRSVEPSSRVSLSLTFVDNLGDLDLEVYRPGAQEPLLVAASATNDETLMFDAPYGGDFFVRIVGKAADTNVYGLRASVEPGAGMACLDDAFEPNDTIATATATGAVQAQPLQGTMCQGDDDWYAIPLEAGRALLADLRTEPGADLELKLYPPDTREENTTPLAASTGVLPRESIGALVPNAGDYLLRVEAFNDRQISPYTLRWRTFDPAACGPDAIDRQGRGDSQLDPFALAPPPTSRHDLRLCADADEDWFQVAAPAGFLNVFRLSFVPGQTLFDLRLLDVDGTVLADTAGEPPADFRQIRRNVEGPAGSSQPLLLHVVPIEGQAGGAYGLSHDAIEVFPCAPDPEEPNEDAPNASRAASASMTPVVLDDLTLCASTRGAGNVGDEDWFIVNPPAAGARIDAEITFERGDLFLELRSPGGAVRACANALNDRCLSDGNTLREHVTFTATVAAPYFLRVGSIYGSPAIEAPPPDADTPYTLRVEHHPP